ncbi:hypothetical protein M9H77_16860 [Catharanthus roseus]|uniref:Uncharacterized protein n=1 Tax=Catharanthus roseus TaxID=4058 RepID=A0ACC0B2Y9_CATRO|nr:hypothetical protein M9H77_16860 [Catharanthus roseus]
MGVQLFVIERSYGVRLVLTIRYRNLVPMASLTQDSQRYNRQLKFYAWDFGSMPRGPQISYSAAVDLVAELGVSQIGDRPWGLISWTSFFSRGNNCVSKESSFWLIH